MYNGIKTAFSHLSISHLIAAPVTALIGVDEPLTSVLERLTIHTVGDLGRSRFFSHALALTSEEAETYIPSEWIDKVARGYSKQSLIHAEPHVLMGLSSEVAQILQQEVGLATLSDMAKWGPFVAAKQLTSEIHNTHDSINELDPLIPVARAYATEARYYEQALMDVSLAQKTSTSDSGNDGIFHISHVNHPLPLAHSDLSLLNLWEPEPEPITESTHLLDAFAPVNEGFTFPALGGLLKFKQAWIPHGLSLGNLLHSIALAPGEATRVAITEWSRTLSGSVTEAGDESEALDSKVEQSRSIDEIQKSVLEEELDSSDDLNTDASQSQANITGSVSGGNAFVSGNVTAGASGSSSKSRAKRVLNSRGRKAVGAEVAQRITSATQQQSSLERSRRASSVHEVRESESQTVTTRVIANYNHMHALTMYYYEVVQIFNMRLSINESTPLLFIPFKLIDFTREDIVKRFRRPLLSAAISDNDRKVIETATDTIAFDIGFSNQSIAFEFDAIVTSLSITQVNGRIKQNKIYLKKQSHESQARVITITYDGRDTHVSNAGPFSLSSIDHIEIVLAIKSFEQAQREADETTGFNVELDRRQWNRAILSIKFETQDNRFERSVTIKNTLNQDLLRSREKDVFGSSPTADAINTLQVNRVYYSQAIWQALDRDTLAMLLSNYEIGGVQAIELVEPDIVVTRGNLMGFRLSVGTEENPIILNNYGSLFDWWQKWRQQHVDSVNPIEEQVPMPTGGIHGEAVLGQSNCAEKIDLTRFWDWQDSPIPLTPDSFALKTPGGGASVDGPAQMGTSNIPTQAPQSYPPGATLGEAIKAMASQSLVEPTADATAIQRAAENALNAATKANEQGLDASTQATIASQTMHLAQITELNSLQKSKVEANAKVKIAQTGATMAAKIETQNNLLKQTNTRLGGIENQIKNVENSALGQSINININNDNDVTNESSATSTSATKGGSSSNSRSKSTSKQKPSKPEPSSQITYSFGDFTLNFGSNNSFTVKPKPDSGRPEPQGTFLFINNLIHIDFGDDNSHTDNSSNDHINTGDKIKPTGKGEPGTTYKGPGGNWSFSFEFNPQINAPIINIEDSFNHTEDNSSIIIIINPDGFEIPEQEQQETEEPWLLDINSADYAGAKSFILLALDSIKDENTKPDGMAEEAYQYFLTLLENSTTKIAEWLIIAMKAVFSQLGSNNLKFVANLLLNSGKGHVSTQISFHKATGTSIDGTYEGTAIVLGGDDSKQAGAVLKNGAIDFKSSMVPMEIAQEQDAYHLRYGSLNLTVPIADQLETLIKEVLLKSWQGLSAVIPNTLVTAPFKGALILFIELGAADAVADAMAKFIVTQIKSAIGDNAINAINFAGVELQTIDMSPTQPNNYSEFTAPKATPSNAPVVIYLADDGGNIVAEHH